MTPAWRGALLASLIVSLSAGDAVAQSSGAASEARSAYERGSRAYQAHDYALAAREFARADSFQPSDAAIEAALEASLRAGDPVLAMELVERAQGRPLDDRARRALDHASTAFSRRVGRLTFPCGAARSCHVFLDGSEVVQQNAPAIVTPGHHSIRLVVDGDTTVLEKDVAAGTTLNILPDPIPPSYAASAATGGERENAPAPSTMAPAPANDAGERPEGTTPAHRTNDFVAIGTGALAVLAAGAIVVSYVDLRAKRSSFEDGACGTDGSAARPLAADCIHRASAGQSAELRTEILLGVTAAAALTTAAFVIFRPFDRKPVRAVAAPAPALRVGASASMRSLAIQLAGSLP